MLKSLIIPEASLNFILTFDHLELKTLEIVSKNLLLLYAKTQKDTKVLSKKENLGHSFIVGTHSVPPLVKLECILSHGTKQNNTSY